MQFSSTSPYFHIQVAMWIFAISLYRLTNLPKPQAFEVNVVDLRLDVFRFIAKKQFVSLEICDSHFSC